MTSTSSTTTLFILTTCVPRQQSHHNHPLYYEDLSHQHRQRYRQRLLIKHRALPLNHGQQRFSQYTTIRQQHSIRRRLSPTCMTFSSSSTNFSDDEKNSHEKLQNLRARLESALQAQDFKEAAIVRDMLSELELSSSSDETLQLTLANDAFYNAFSQGDLNGMSELWMKSDSVSCAHAVSGLVTGYENVISSWNQLFATVGKPGSNGIDIHVLALQIHRNLAWIVCKQSITGVRGRNVIFGERVATNMYQKRTGKWFLVHHHSSPVVVEEGDPEKRVGEDLDGDGKNLT